MVHNDYPLAPDKLEFKNEILFDYQLKILHDHNIFISNVKKPVSNFFCKEKYMLHYKNLKHYSGKKLNIKRYTVY